MIKEWPTPSVSIHLNSILQCFKEKHIFLRWYVIVCPLSIEEDINEADCSRVVGSRS